MGYSCRRSAQLCVDEIEKRIIPATGPSNTWMYKGNTYFWERGREQDDGAITGTVWLIYDKPGSPIGENSTKLCHRSGTIRVEGHGKLTRWPFIPREVRQEVLKMYENKEFDDIHAFCIGSNEQLRGSNV
jgi:hypothetical protein